MKVLWRDRLTGMYWRARHRIGNRIRDALAWLSGYCNDRPWRPAPGGAYVHWRCAHPAGHAGWHRYNNYVWDGYGQVEYAPIPDGRPTPQQRWDRYSTHTRRQVRQAEAWYQRQQARRAAA